MPLHPEVRKILERAQSRYGKVVSQAGARGLRVSMDPGGPSIDLARIWGEAQTHIADALEKNTLKGHPRAIDAVLEEHDRLEAQLSKSRVKDRPKKEQLLAILKKALGK